MKKHMTTGNDKKTLEGKKMKTTLKLLTLAAALMLLCSAAEAGTRFRLHISAGTVAQRRVVTYYPASTVGVTRYVPTYYWGSTYYQYPYKYTHRNLHRGHWKSGLYRSKYHRVPLRRLSRTRYRYRNGYYYFVR